MLTLMLLIAGLQVHEWGVITQTPLLFTGAVRDSLSLSAQQPFDYNFGERAPVVYFHGDSCNVTVRVTFPNMGYTTAVFPNPDEGGVNSTYLVWENLHLSPLPENGLDAGWARLEFINYPASVWRDVDALSISTAEECDNFLYYECVPGSTGELPFINESGNRSFRMPYGEIPCAVLTSSAGRPMFGVFTLADILTDIPKGLQFLDEPAQLRREVWQWADGVLNEDEFNTFWTTWESRFLEDSSTDVMILYRVPEEIVERIASLEVIPDIHTEVTMNRFIIAELPYKTQ